MHVNNLGELKYVSKTRGQRAVFQRFIERVRETGIEPEKQLMCISHGDDEASAVQLRDMVQSTFGVKDVVIWSRISSWMASLMPVMVQPKLTPPLADCVLVHTKVM